MLPHTLTNLRRILPQAQILVVDNGSDDGTDGFVAAEFPDVVFIANRRNDGFGAAANLGAASATGRLLLFLNPDALPVAASFEKLARLEEVSLVGLRACRIRESDGSEHFPRYRQWGWLRESVWSLAQAFVMPRQMARARPPADESVRDGWVPGAAIIARREEFRSVGGFDPQYFMYFEDRDLSRRYRCAGLPVTTTDAVTLVHDGGASSTVPSTQRLTWGQLGHLEYVSKWDSPRAAAHAARWCLAILSAIGIVGRAVRPVPMVGPRGRRKAEAARKVREDLLAFGADTRQTEAPYRRAFEALRAAPAIKRLLSQQGASDSMQTDTHTPALPVWALTALRSPVGGAPLKRVGDGFQTEDERARVYLDVAGRPRLMQDFDWSSADRAGGRAVGESLARRLNARVKGAASLNLVSARNYRSLRRLLEVEHSPDAPARVLVIGGGELGVGMESLIESDRIELVESDVYPGPRVQILCDVHQLPFADSSFDAVVAQAVLEHVLDPPAAAKEIHRVLRPRGIVYSEIPFMQQVHEGPFDFTRFTELGQRRLFRMFDELDRGPVAGPGTALAWSFRYLARSVPRRPGPAVVILDRIAVALTFWVKYADRLVLGHPGARDGASGTYFLGRRREQPVSDAEIIDSYRGAVAVPSRRVAR